MRIKNGQGAAIHVLPRIRRKESAEGVAEKRTERFDTAGRIRALRREEEGERVITGYRYRPRRRTLREKIREIIRILSG